MALVAHRLGSWRAALALAVAFATMPAILIEAQNGRPYAWLLACLSLFTLSLAALLDHPRLARGALARSAPAAARRLRWAWAGTTLGAVAVVALIGAGFGMLYGLASFAISRRRRDFTSTHQVLARSYQIVVDPELTHRAQQILAGPTPGR